MLPGELIAGVSEEEWITREAYVTAQHQNETLHGFMHVHLRDTPFSDNNIGFFLDLNVAIAICRNPQDEYFVMLRTERTSPSRNGIFREALREYTTLARTHAKHYFIEQQREWEDAKRQALYAAMKEICKKYNVALYIGQGKSPAQKVT